MWNSLLALVDKFEDFTYFNLIHYCLFSVIHYKEWMTENGELFLILICLDSDWDPVTSLFSPSGLTKDHLAPLEVDKLEQQELQ